MVGQLARLGITAGVALIAFAALLLVFLRPGSAEFVITVVTCGMGMFLGLFSTLVLTIERKRK